MNLADAMNLVGTCKHCDCLSSSPSRSQECSAGRLDHDFVYSNAGKKQDERKERYDLIPFAALREIVRVLGFGARKYGDENWRKVERARSRYLAAAFRHIVAWQQGETNDSESGLHHLGHAGCCLLFLLAFELNDEPR